MLNEFQPEREWVTSDLHFWHAGILSERLGLTHRRERWPTIEDMNAELIQMWRDTVGAHDIVYHVGDLFHRCGVEKVKRLLRDLSGHWIMLAPGNHDKPILTKLQRRGELPSNVRLLPDHAVQIAHGDRPIFINHYPPSQYDLFNALPENSIYLHGHSHGRGVQQLPHRALDIGWDVHRRILSLDDIRTHFREAKCSDS